MATPVEMPKLGNTVEECLIARWAKRKGDVVNEGDLVAEIETDKATFEITAPVEGTVLETFFAEGALVPVFTNLFVIGTPGEDPAPYRPGEQGRVGLPACPSEGETLATQRADQEVYPTSPRLQSSEGPLGGHLSPRARRFAEERNFNPIGVPGTGPGGRVLEEDLRRAYSEGVPPAAHVAAAAPATPPAPAPVAKPATIREKIARRMREALSSTAQYTLHSSADATG